MISRSELETYLYNYLSLDEINDYAPNGLQIEGRKEIKSIVTAVTASNEAIQGGQGIVSKMPDAFP